MPKNLIPFTRSYPDVLDSIILSYLTFRDLNQFVEHQQHDEEGFLSAEAQQLLKKSHPGLINLKAAKAAGNFSALIENIKIRVLPAVGLANIILEAEDGTEAAYNELCAAINNQLRALIRNEFYPLKVQTKLEASTVRDCIFHYCQYEPIGAGKLMNQHIWKFWNSFTTDCLIEYGADVNVKFNDAAYPTLFQALRWNASAYTVRRLIEAGADYDAYQETRAGASFTIMLVAALSSSAEVLATLAEMLPGKAVSTLLMLDEMLNDESGAQYSCKFNDITSLPGANASEKLYYDREEILIAKAHLLIAIHGNRHDFICSDKDKKDMLLYVQHQLNKTTNFEDCLSVFHQHIHAGYWHDSHAMFYSSEKVRFIEMIQQKMSEILVENKRKKENTQNDSYYQNALSMLQRDVFSSKHFENGVSDRYVNLFVVKLQNYAIELQYLAARRKRFEEQIHYAPSCNTMFQAVASAAKPSPGMSYDNDVDRHARKTH
jgi:hypothetical protein